MSLIKRLQKKFFLIQKQTSSVEELATKEGKFSNMEDGGILTEVQDRSVVDIYRFENEENLTEKEWERLKYMVTLGNPEGEYIASSND